MRLFGSNESWAFFKVFSASLVALSAITGLNIYLITGHFRSSEPTNSVRGLASVSNETVETRTPDTSRFIYDCKAKDVQLAFQTHRPKARLEFKGCRSIESLINASNATNGHIFEMKNKGLTSDFLNLEKGINKIEFVANGTPQNIEITLISENKEQPSSALPPSAKDVRP